MKHENCGGTIHRMEDCDRRYYQCMRCGVFIQSRRDHEAFIDGNDASSSSSSWQTDHACARANMAYGWVG